MNILKPRFRRLIHCGLFLVVLVVLNVRIREMGGLIRLAHCEKCACQNLGGYTPTFGVDVQHTKQAPEYPAKSNVQVPRIFPMGGSHQNLLDASG